MVPGPAALISIRHLLEMQILHPCPQPPEAETCGMGAQQYTIAEPLNTYQHQQGRGMAPDTAYFILLSKQLYPKNNFCVSLP